MSDRATNKAATLSHQVPIPTVEIRRVGPGWEQAQLKTDAADTNLHLVDPRDVPATVEIMRQVGEEPLPSPPAPPTPPTETQLRASLAERLTEQHEAEAAMAEATAARDRGAQLVVARQSALGGFHNLDAQITEFTVQALRGNGRCDLPDELRAQLAARERARADVGAAEAASFVLSGALVEARNAAEAATRIARNVATAILSTVVLRTVERHKQALGEVESTYREMCEFDRFLSSGGGITPFAVGSVLRNPPIDHRGMITSPGLDTSYWRAALAALLADPLGVVEAEIEIDAG